MFIFQNSSHRIIKYKDCTICSFYHSFQGIDHNALKNVLNSLPPNPCQQIIPDHPATFLAIRFVQVKYYLQSNQASTENPRT